jgi:hypothetical protein
MEFSRMSFLKRVTATFGFYDFVRPEGEHVLFGTLGDMMRVSKSHFDVFQDLMYKDPVKWSLCFQSYVQMTMLDIHTRPVAQPIKLMERSIFSAKYDFF